MPPSPEMGPAPQGGETVPRPVGGEQMPVRQPEQAPARTETRENLPAPVGGSPGDPAFTPVVMPTLPPPPIVANPDPIAAADDTSPVVAEDVDLIEKEWVDKAKKIVAATKTDPYEQEKEVSKLQADYLKKRYGKEVKLTAD